MVLPRPEFTVATFESVAVALADTIRVTASGIERITGFPRELFVR